LTMQRRDTVARCTEGGRDHWPGTRPSPDVR
jgi:hypothetical protein